MKRVEWSSDAQKALKPAIPNDDDENLIKNQVIEGKAILLKSDVDAVGYAVVRGDGDDFVIVAGAGAGCRYGYKELEYLAKKSGFKYMRTHVKRKGLMKILESQGYEKQETVFKKSILNG